MNLKFVCWNTHQKPLYAEVADLVAQTQADFVVLVESTASTAQMKSYLLNKTGTNFAHSPNILQFRKAELYYRADSCTIRVLTENLRFSIREITTATGIFHLVVVHLPSKVNWGHSSDHDSMCSVLMSDIENIERQEGHRRTIIVGDFNMNPFETGMVAASGLHSVMDREIATNRHREVLGREYHFFYNPMWAFLGSKGRGEVSGTHYYNTGAFVNYYWNMFDQVLIRPDLLAGFEEDTLEIVTKIGDLTLLKQVRGENRIDTDISDHLPLTFAINI